MDAGKILQVLPLIKPDLSNYRKELCRAFVLSAATGLPKKENGFTADEIISGIKEKFGIERIPPAIVLETLDSLVTDHTLSRKGTSYLMEMPIPQMDTDFAEKISKEFEQVLAVKIPDYDKFIHKSYSEAFKLIFECLVRILGESTEPSALIMDGIHAQENQKRLLTSLQETLPSGEAERFVDIFIEYCSSGKKLVSEALFSVYQGIICVDLLLKGGKLVDAVGMFGENSSLFLDTNVITACLLPSNPRHELTIATLKFARDLGFEIVYSPLTKLEFNRLLQAANYEMTTPVLGYRLADNELVTDFLCEEQNITWFERFIQLSNYERLLSDLFGASLKGLSEAKEAETEERRLDISLRTVIRISGRIRSANAISHDIEIYKNIRVMRKAQQSGSYPSPWLITLDNTLVAFDELERQYREEEFGYVMHIRTLLGALTPFWNPKLDGADRGLLVSGLVRNLVVAPRTALTLQDYARLLTQKLSLDIKDSELLLKVIMLSPLKERLAEGLKIEDPEVISSTTIALLKTTDVVKIIEAKEEVEKRNVELQNGLKTVGSKYITEHAELEAYKRLATRPVIVMVQAGLPPGVPDLLLGVVERIKASNPKGLDEAGVTEKDLEAGNLAKIRDFVIKLEGWINRAGAAATNISALLPVLQLISSLLISGA